MGIEKIKGRLEFLRETEKLKDAQKRTHFFWTHRKHGGA